MICSGSNILAAPGSLRASFVEADLKSVEKVRFLISSLFNVTWKRPGLGVIA